MPSKNVDLTDHLSEFVDLLVASGKYKDASEVLREGLRLLEQKNTEQAHQLSVLQKLANQGFEQIDQGQGIALSSGQELADHIASLGQRAAGVAQDTTGD